MTFSIENWKAAAQAYLIARRGLPLPSYSPGVELRFAYQDNEAAFVRITRLLRQDTTTYDVWSASEIDPPEVLTGFKVYKVVLHIKKDTDWNDLGIMADFLADQSGAVALVGVREMGEIEGSWGKTILVYRDYLENVEHLTKDQVDDWSGDFKEGVLEVGRTTGQFAFNVLAPVAILALVGIFLWTR